MWLLQYVQGLKVALPYLYVLVDLVEMLNLAADPPPSGITRTTGMCSRRKGGGGGGGGGGEGAGGSEALATTKDLAFKISDRAVASVPTARIFPGIINLTL